MNIESPRERHLKLLEAALEAAGSILNPNQDIHVDKGTVINLSSTPLTENGGAGLVQGLITLMEKDAV